MDNESPIYSYLNNPSFIDYPGKIAAIYFVSGCNFVCNFCHNAVLLGSKKRGMSWSDVEASCVKFIDNWVDGVVISGGEPTIHESLPELVLLFKKHNMLIKLDTNGSNPEMLKKIIPFIDYVAMDIKCSLQNYPTLTGFSFIDRISESIAIIKKESKDYEFRTTILEDFHSEQEVLSMANTIGESKRYFLQKLSNKQNEMNGMPKLHENTSIIFIENVREKMLPIVKNVFVR
jgi:pyruvate formate lyase activating enzyme